MGEGEESFIFCNRELRVKRRREHVKLAFFYFLLWSNEKDHRNHKEKET